MRGLIRTLIAAFAAAVLVESAWARDLDASYDPAAGASQNKGAVAISMTMPPHDDMAHWGLSNFDLWYNAVGRIWPNRIRLPRKLKNRRDTPSEYADVYGQLQVFELPAGEYEFDTFTYTGYRNAGVSAGVSQFGISPLRFTVTAGRVTYLGRAQIDEKILDPGAPIFAWPRFVDAREADLPLLRARFPRIGADRIDFGVADPGQWTRAWARSVMCLPWTAKGVEAYQRSLDGGVLPWRTDFREFALTLGACPTINGSQGNAPGPRDGMQRNLAGGDVVWQGVVRDISVGAGALSLTLDTGTDDLRARIYTSYYARAGVAGIQCCVLNGEFESWRVVKPGDRIEVHGTIDPLTPLQFFATPETAATAPIRPVLNNARAVVLSH